MTRPYFSSSSDELASLAVSDLVGVLAELGHRRSRKARRLIGLLETVGDDPETEPQEDEAARYVELSRRDVKRTRVEHECSSCGGSIPAGQALERIAYRFEGEFGTSVRCDGCQNGGEWGTMGDERWRQEMQPAPF